MGVKRRRRAVDLELGGRDTKGKAGSVRLSVFRVLPGFCLLPVTPISTLPAPVLRQAKLFAAAATPAPRSNL